MVFTEVNELISRNKSLLDIISFLYFFQIENTEVKSLKFSINGMMNYEELLSKRDKVLVATFVI